MRINTPRAKENGARLLVLITFLAAITMVGIASSQPTATAEPAGDATVALDVDWDAVLYAGKKCNFDSDCSHGKCRSGQCGGCNYNDECNGWGICKGNQCGSCNFDSECSGFGKCSSGKCTESPY